MIRIFKAVRLSRRVRRDLQQIHGVALLLLLLISLPALSIPALLAWLISPGISEGGIERFWAVLVTTAPLVASIALIGVFCWRKWMPANLYYSALLSALILLGLPALFGLVRGAWIPGDLVGEPSFCRSGLELLAPKQFAEHWGHSSPEIQLLRDSWEKQHLGQDVREKAGTLNAPPAPAAKRSSGCQLNQPGDCGWYRAIRCGRVARIWPLSLLTQGLLSPLLAFWDYYGFRDFSSSLLVGLFLSWILAVKAWPYLLKGSHDRRRRGVLRRPPMGPPVGPPGGRR